MSVQFPGGNLPPGRIGNLPRGTGFGGTRGGGALVTQVLVQFLTQYQREGLEQLAKDIKALQEQATAARAVEAQARANVLAFDRAQTERQNALNKILNDRKGTYAELTKLQAEATAQEKATGSASRENAATRTKILADLEAAGVITAREVTLLQNQNRLIEQQAAAKQTYINAANNRLAIEEQITAQLTVQQQLQEFGNRALTSLRNIFVSAIGATIGAAIIFDPLQKGIQAVGVALGDLIDPGRKAADVLADVAKSIEQIASDRNISNLEAATELLKSLNIPGAEGQAGALAGSSQLKALQDQADQLSKIAEYLVGRIALEQKINDELRTDAALIALVAQGDRQAAGELKAGLDILNLFPGGLRTALNMLTALAPLISTLNPNFGAAAARANELFDALFPIPGTMDAISAATKESADAYAELAQAAREAAINASFDTQIAAAEASRDTAIAAAQAYAEANINLIRDRAEAATTAIQDDADAKIARLEKRIKAIGDQGPSAATNELAAAIERLNKAEQDRRFNAQLADIDEQRSLILLRERLALTDKQINLDDYQGKARLVAIDALLNRMQEQNAAQDRFNKLLDIQYQISQGVRRQQGETIQDFIARRAQYYRGLLEQAADLQRQGPEAELKAERDRVQTTLELRDLENRRTELLRNRAHEAQLKRLQDELKASQEADRRAAASEQQRLRDRIEAIRNNAADAIKEINRTRDHDIEATQRARDQYVADQKARTEAQITQLKQQRDDVLKWTNDAESARYAAATNGAKSIAELNAISGALAGANFSVAYVRTQLQALGFRPGDPTYEATVKNFETMLSAYQSRFNRLEWQGVGVIPAASHAEGGIIPLRNSMNLSNDIRIGERGPEGGLMTSQGMAVLNNEIMSQLRQMDAGKAPFAGSTFNVTGTGDPYVDQYRLKQMLREVIKETIH